MTAEARRTLGVIRECIEAENYALSFHFSKRMHERGLFWPDVLAVIDRPTDVGSQGMDEYNRRKWIICGEAADAGEVEIVCAVETDDSGAEFITLYWED